MTDTAPPRRRGAAGHDPARAPRRAVLLGPPLPDLERAGDRAARRGQAEHRGVPADRRAARPRRPLLPRPTTRARSTRCSPTSRRADLRERGWAKIDLGQGPTPHAEGGFGTQTGKLELRPDYEPPAEVADAALAERFPLALITPKTHLFLNSTFANQGRQHSAQPSPRSCCTPTTRRRPGRRRRRPGAGVQRPRRPSRARYASPTTPGPACSLHPWAGGTRTTRMAGAARPRRRRRSPSWARAPTFNDNRVEVEPPHPVTPWPLGPVAPGASPRKRAHNPPPAPPRAPGVPGPPFAAFPGSGGQPIVVRRGGPPLSETGGAPRPRAGRGGGGGGGGT